MSIRTHILIYFTLLILGISSLLLGLQYFSNQRLAIEAVNKSFYQQAQHISTYIVNTEESIKKKVAMLSLHQSILVDINPKTIHPMANYFSQVLLANQALNAIYIAQKDNSLYELINLSNNPALQKKYNTPKDALWLELIVQNKKITLKFLTLNLEILKQKTLNEDFSVTQRGWYKQALQENQTIRTNIYKFQSTQHYGITFAKKIRETDSVLAIDYTVDEMNQFLSQKNFDKDSYILLYDEHGFLIASSKKVPQQKWKQVYNFFQKKQTKSINTFTEWRQDYFTYHSLSKNINPGSIEIAILLPKERLLAPYNEKIIEAFFAALLFILLSIPFIFYATSRIVKPIHTLMKENYKIIHRDFTNVKRIDTNITEFKHLSKSLLTMSQSIQIYQEEQAKLLNSIVKLIAEAIDAKSSYTGGHCERVPKIAELLVKAASDSKEEAFKEFSFTKEDEWREFHIGAWLHDCGKVTTPEFVVDKATKLETIYNRIHEIRTRFEVLFRDAQIEYLNTLLAGGDRSDATLKLQKTQLALIDDFNFIAKANEGGEFMSEASKERIAKIAEKTWWRNFDNKIGLSTLELMQFKNTTEKLPVQEKLLADKHEHIIKREHFNYENYIADGFKEEVPEYLYNYGEVYNLQIEKGTLTHEERFKINEHVIMSIKMLEQLPFPKELQKIPEYAGTHHETMIGTGYPRKLTKAELSIPARVMAIADIYEALTASDRPYKKAKTISQALKIMSFMVKDEHIDADIFKLFLESGVYLEYAKEHLKKEQIDEVDLNSLTV